jgi:hypothetical protein
MDWCLAYAQGGDNSDLNLRIVLVSIGVIAGIAVLGLIPVCIAWSRRHRRGDLILAAAVVWGVLTGAVVLRWAVTEIQWSREWLMCIKSGYYDPNDQSDAPQRPWQRWTGLGLGYGGLIIWSLGGKKRVGVSAGTE